MFWTQTELRWRDGLLAALIPAPGRGLAGLGELDVTAQWERFRTAAPIHLRLGFRVATAVLGGALPRLLGFGGAMGDLAEEEREAVIQRAAALPFCADLVELSKLVACLLYFADPGVQERARARARARGRA